MPHCRLLVLTFCALAFSNACTPKTAEAPSERPPQDAFEVIAYYHGNGDGIERFAVEDLTQVIYGFALLEGNLLDVGPHDDVLRKLVKLKQRKPSLKVLIAFGGWGGCETCSEVFSDAGNRREFAESVLHALRDYGLDGIDLDWEFPAVPGFPGHAYKAEDRENFSALVEVLRRVLGPDYEISFAAGASPDFAERSVDWGKVMPLVDRVNLMSYDFIAGGSDRTGHHAALYTGPENALSADDAVQRLVDLGVPPAKIVVGAAFYARVWRDVRVESGSALGQPGTFHESVAYRDFAEYFGEGCETYWDERAAAPYRYCGSEGLFATYDDRRSVAAKTRYALERSLGGIMFWQLAQDNERDGLLSAIDEAVRQAAAE